MNGHEPEGHQHSAAGCGLPSADEAPRLIAQVNLYVSAAGISCSFVHSPGVSMAGIAHALERFAAAIRDGEYIVDPTYDGTTPGGES